MTRLALVLSCTLALLALAPTAQATPADFVGMTSEDVFAGDAAYRAENLSRQRSVGVRILRQPFDWSMMEPAPGQYDFSRYDSYMLALAANRMKVLPILFNPPRFRAPSRRGATCAPRRLATMAAFARALARRYGPRGSLWAEHPEVRRTPITSWQIWNEPSLGPYWCNKPNAKQYVAMLRTVGKAIKGVHRRAEIVTAGLPPSKLGYAVPLRKYIRQLYAAGGKRVFDTLAINSYAQGTAQLGRLLTEVRNLMRERRDRAKIWVTEIGWGDRGPRHRFIVGARGQATNIRNSIRYMGSRWRRLGLRGFVYFSWRDGRPYAPDFRNLWGLHTGLLKLNGDPKPAFNAFRSAARALR